MKRALSLILTICFLIVPVSAFGGTMSAESAILIDAVSGRVLYEKNADEQRLIASITKLLTALVVVEQLINLSEVVTIQATDTQTEGSSMYLKIGEEVTVEELLYGLLLCSGNDAALTLARHCGGSVTDFVVLMNEKAQNLGMTESSFENPNGLNGEHHYSTARDMAKVAVACLEDPMIARMVATTTITIGTRTMTNHNKLLVLCEGCIGLKTGYTQLAGRTLVSGVTRDDLTLICVTLDAPDDWNDHCELYDYCFSSYESKVLVQQGSVVTTLPTVGSLVPMIELVADQTVRYPIQSNEQVTVRYDLPECVLAPMASGTIAGTIEFFLDNVKIAETTLSYRTAIAKDTVKTQSLWAKIKEFF